VQYFPTPVTIPQVAHSIGHTSEPRATHEVPSVKMYIASQVMIVASDLHVATLVPVHRVHVGARGEALE
jgi:hypothetical protein